MAEPVHPIPALPPWPKAAPVKPWRERAAERLATMAAAASAAGRAAPAPYWANPVNIVRHSMGEDSATIETNRINQEITAPPTTAESPMMIWPRSLGTLGR